MSLKSHGRKRIGVTVTAIAAAAALALTGCSSSSTPDDGKAGITVVGGTGTLAENFNPFSPTALQGTNGILYESLFWYNAASDEEPTPVLATAYEWNADGTELTITTRDDVKWSDGEQFTAEDVAFTFNLMAETPELNTTGLAAVAEAVDETTAVLRFQESSFMQEPSVLGNRGIVPEHVWKDVENPATDANSEPVGTGPFVLESFTPQSFVFAKNKNYWEVETVSIDEVRAISLDSADASSAALLAGDIDWMSAFLPGLEKLLKDNETLTYVNTPALTASIFTCSNAALGCAGPQTDPAVRQAIYHAIDRDQLNQLAGGGFAEPASPVQIVPGRDDKWVSNPELLEAPSSADVDTASQILEDAGWVEGSGGIREKDGEKLTLSIQTVSGWSDFISLNDAMTQQLAAVGIELKPTQLSWNEWNNNQTMGTFQLSLDSIGLQPSNNPYFTYQKWYVTDNTVKVGESASAGNAARYSNEAVDAAVRAAGQTVDEEEQKKQYAIVQEQIAADMPYIPIYLNSMLTEFSTANAVGWPSNEDKYALPAVWKSWDNGIILKTIEPAKK